MKGIVSFWAFWIIALWIIKSLVIFIGWNCILVDLVTIFKPMVAWHAFAIILLYMGMTFSVTLKK